MLLLRSRLHPFVAAVAITGTAALTVQEYFARHSGGGPLAFKDMLLAQGISAFVWLVFTPLVILPLARRLPPTPRGLALHAVVGAALTVAHTFVVAVLFASRFYGWSPLAYRDVFLDRMYTSYSWGVFIYFLIVGVIVLRRLTPPPATASVEPSAQPEPAERKGHLRRILVRSQGRATLVPTDQIDWLEAADNNVVLHAGGTRHSIRGTLTGLGDRLDPSRFVRVRRSAIVNVERVREVQPWFHGEVVAILRDESRVTVARNYRERFLAALEA